MKGLIYNLIIAYSFLLVALGVLFAFEGMWLEMGAAASFLFFLHVVADSAQQINKDGGDEFTHEIEAASKYLRII